MQKYTFPAMLLGAAILLGSCDEKPITIPQLSVGKRNVLVEEITGVRCYNCPDGAAKLAALREQIGENLIVVSIHSAYGYDEPFSESKYDFRTAAGKELTDFIGSPIGFPSAAVDRRLLPGEQDVYLSPETAWAGPILQDLTEAPVIGVFLQNTYDPTSRQLDVAVNLAPDATLLGEHRLTVLITQDSIQDYQKVGTVKVPDYMHRHVFRTTLTQPSGNVISEALSAGATVTKNFSFSLPTDWDARHCNVIAFVHHGGTPDKEVLQVAEAPVQK